MTNGNDKSLESWIWDAACSIRGANDAPKFRDYILPLIFTKRLCDVFDDCERPAWFDAPKGAPSHAETGNWPVPK